MGSFTKVAEYFEWVRKEGYNLQKVPTETQSQRLSTCEECSQFRKRTRQCAKCGCFMDVKTQLKYDPVKSTLQLKKVEVKCPLGKW